MDYSDTPGEPKCRVRTLILVSLTLLLSMSTWFSASAVLPQIREAWNLSSAASTWLTIAVQLGFVVGAVVSSLINLSDILSPRYVILVGATGSALANLFINMTAQPAVGIALRFATGFFLAGVYPPAFKFISTWFQKGRGMALGVLAAALVLGNGIPHLINGLGGLNWHIVITITSAMTVVGGLIAAFALREGPYPFPRAIFDPKQAGKVFTNKGVWLASLGYIGHMWELFALYAWFAVFIGSVLSHRGWPGNTSAAFATFAIFMTGSLGSWAGGVIADRWGRMKTTILMMAISGTCALVIGLLIDAPIWILLLVSLVWAFAFLAPGPAVGILAILRLKHLDKIKLIAKDTGKQLP